MDIQKWPIFSVLRPEFINDIRMTSVFGSGNEAIIITKSDKVFGIGSNVSGCLGLGTEQSANEPVLIPSLCGKRIKGFTYGNSSHVIAYSETGEIYGWGSNVYGEIGESDDVKVLIPTLISSLSRKTIIEVACGGHHSLALCENGEVYGWGRNDYGQVGVGQVGVGRVGVGRVGVGQVRVGQVEFDPRRVDAEIGGKIVISIACNMNSSMALLDNGEVYGWGCNNCGQLGIGETIKKSPPIQIPTENIVVKKIVCGYSHTLALSDRGVIFSWGSNKFGQLGTGDQINSDLPIRITTDMGRITDIAANPESHLSAAVSDNSTVYMWGKCRGRSIQKPYLTPFNSLHDVFLNFSSPSVTYKPLKPKRSVQTSVTETFKNAFDDPESSDLTIMVENKPIYVHKCILKLRSDYFKKMFQNNWSEDSKPVLEVKRNNYKIYRAFLQYLYTDEVDLSPEEALDLLDQSNEFGTDSLIHRCEQIIQFGLTIENVAMIYARAILLNSKRLEKSCLTFASNHITEVVQTEGFSALNKCDLLKFILELCDRGIFKT